MPLWLRNLLAILIAILFSYTFYHFFISPYSYRWKACDGRKEYGVCLPCGYAVHGIDISHYQDNINWDTLVSRQNEAFPICFVFIKATEGRDHGDAAFYRNFREARSHGFICGAYHFYNPNSDALQQANFFIHTVKLEPGDLPPVLDVESKGHNNKNELQRNVKLWLERVGAHYGVKPILYTSYKFRNSYLNDSLFNSYPYWIAHYYVDSITYKRSWKFWQHSNVGSVPGIRRNVDLNVFNGSLEELMDMTLK